MKISKLNIFRKHGKKIRIQKGNSKISGNVRLKLGLYRNYDEREKYIKKSLSRRLP